MIQPSEASASPAQAGASTATDPDPGLEHATEPCAANPAAGSPEAELASLQSLAEQWQGQPERLLQLLRQIEQLHRSIQDGPFRASLPADRNALFLMLAEMERSGGWPYIPRLQLRTFLDLLQREPGAPEPDQGSEPLAA